MPARPRPPLRIQTQHDDRVVVLGCETCELTTELHTSDPQFAMAVQAFFEKHTGCPESANHPS